MASLFDYVKDRGGRKAPTGYTFRTSNSGNDTYTPVNQNNRSNRLKRNPGSMGGGRSPLDNQRGFSNQGIGSFSNRQPGLFGSRTAMPSPAAPIIEEEEQISGKTDEGLLRNIRNDAVGMSTDLIRDPLVNAAKKFPPGLMGLFGRMGDSIGNNRQDHKYLNSVFGRASPDKTMAFFDKSTSDANRNMGTDNMSTMSIGDTSRGSSLGQAMKYFERAGITEQNMKRFMDPNDKFYGNQAYLSSQAGGSGAEDFATGMSFIKNAKSSANLARDVAGQQFTQNAYENPSSRASPLDDYSAYEDITETITEDSYPNRPPLFEEDFSQQDEDVEGLTYNQRFNKAPLLSDSYNDFFNQPGNNAYPPRKNPVSYLNNGFGFLEENEDGEPYYRY